MISAITVLQHLDSHERGSVCETRESYFFVEYSVFGLTKAQRLIHLALIIFFHLNCYFFSPIQTSPNLEAGT